MAPLSEELSLGQKIRQFRQRAKISQFELEIQIGASPGSLSRIESGQINPTKETIVKIIEALDLRSYDAASLYNLDLNELPRMVEIAKKLNSSLDLYKVLQNAVNEVVYELDLLGSVICLIDKDILYAKTFTQSWYTQLVMNIIKVPFNSFRLDLKANSTNLFLKSVLDKKSYLSNKLNDFTRDVMPDKVADLCQKVANHKSGIIIPIVVNNKSIGGILFTKDYVDDFKNEYKILETFTEYIGITVTNAQKYKQLQDEVSQLKNER